MQLQAGDKEMIDKWKDICEVSQFPFRLGLFFFFKMRNPELEITSFKPGLHQIATVAT